jgi:uncharacterized protein DUF3224
MKKKANAIVTVWTFAVSLATVVVLFTPTAAFAAQPQVAQGTFDFAVVAVTAVHQADGNLLITQTLRGQFAGDVTGSVDEVEQLVVHPSGDIEFRGTDVCSCSVGGRSGTFVDRFVGQVAADGRLTGTVRSISSSGGLAGLHFEGDIAGPTSGPNAGTYSVRMHFAA